MNIMILENGPIQLSVDHDSGPVRLIRLKSDQAGVPTNKPAV